MHTIIQTGICALRTTISTFFSMKAVFSHSVYNLYASSSSSALLSGWQNVSEFICWLQHWQWTNGWLSECMHEPCYGITCHAAIHTGFNLLVISFTLFIWTMCNKKKKNNFFFVLWKRWLIRLNKEVKKKKNMKNKRNWLTFENIFQLFAIFQLEL